MDDWRVSEDWLMPSWEFVFVVGDCDVLACEAVRDACVSHTILVGIMGSRVVLRDPIQVDSIFSSSAAVTILTPLNSPTFKR